MQRVVAVLLFGVAVAGAQQFTCPHETGFYPHEVACDQYWACLGSVPTLKTCGNGLAFADTDVEYLSENCDYYHNVDCATRPERQPAIVTPNCPYLYGIFEDPQNCAVFWSCWGGDASRYECAPGLAYDPISRICTWIDKVPTCKDQLANKNAELSCPASGAVAVTGSFSRHAHPEDCREYFVCFDSVPRKYGCPIGTVFQIGATEGSGQCTEPTLVPGCEDYYGGLDLTVNNGDILSGVGGPANQQPSAAGAEVRSERVRPSGPSSQGRAPAAPLDAPAFN